MSKTKCLIGNSSSGIREGAFIGTPVVNIGSRQSNRERGSNVLDVNHDLKSIVEGVNYQKNHGKYPMEDIYGDGKAGKNIADILARMEDVSIQKSITY